MSNGDDPVLDPQAVLRSFSSSFRGYDSEQVDKHLRSIADALRARAGEVDTGSAELENARLTIEQLTATVSSLEREVDALENAPASMSASTPSPAAVAEPAPFDEARAMQLLGEETTRVLETARQSAATIVANAEAEARKRTESVDEMQATVTAEMADLRKSTDAELADKRSKQETELADKRAAAEKELAATKEASVKDADARVAKATEEAERLLADAQAEADSLAEGATGAATAAREEATALVAAATAEALEARTSAEADAATAKAEADTDAARIRAEAEADSLAAQESARETARLMVVEAQRVREKVLNDLVVRRRQGRQEVDQAKAARDRLGRALIDVRRQLDASVKELDVALPEAKAALSALAKPTAPVDDEAQIRELELELDAAKARADQAEVVVASGSAALAPARHKPKTDDDASSDDASDTTSTDASDDDEPVVEAVTDGSGDDASADAESEEDAEPEIEVPEAFLARDVAMTRHGADLRRKLKRVMADEQSDLLDRLQRSKSMSTEDLAPAAEQRSLYLEAVSPAIVATAELGADLYGGSIKQVKVQPLIERLVADVFDPLRQRVESSVAEAPDVDDVLEPLRAHYRDVRLSDVPDLTDDVLAEAFALGGYEAISKGTPVRWMSDPRFEPNSDCFDDTLAEGVVAPDPFPTGRTYPTGQPGCRCLVVPWV